MHQEQRLNDALAGRYVIMRQLGAGGMATVYLAQDIKHDREVAIKVLHPELAAALGGDRFLTEIKTTARLQHPHILPLLDSGDAGGLLFYVMPFVAGETLRDRLERERQLPIDDAVRIAGEIADALGAAHAQGIIHRDVKPENILLQGGHALVADFGIALAVQQAGGARMTQTGLSLGTPQYMSPEQALGEKTIDARADIYALGAVTYEMLAGEPPFTGPSVQAIIARVMSEEPRGLASQRKSIPPGVEYAVMRALEKLPADRIGTTAEFVAAMRSDAPLTSMRSAAIPVQRRRARTNAALIALTVASIALATWALTRPSHAPASAMFDAAFPDSEPLTLAMSSGGTGFGAAKNNFAIAPDEQFIVYTAQHNDSTTLWYRSLVDASAHAIPGTGGGNAPRISPDGSRLAFVAGNRTLVVPITGGEPRLLMEGVPPASLLWVSNARLMALDNDGFNLAWLDPEVGVVEKVPLPSKARCVVVQAIIDAGQLVCGFNEAASIVDLKTGAVWPLRLRASDGSVGAAVSGTAFRLIGEYMVYAAFDGSLRAARYDHVAHLIDRPVSLGISVVRDPVGVAHLDVSANGTLGFVPASAEAGGRMVVLHEGGTPAPLPIERAVFNRFDLSRDRRNLAAVVTTPDGEELRIYDLRNGRQQTWLRAASIGAPLWSPSGDRMLVRVVNGDRGAFVMGSPGTSSALDTLMQSDRVAPVLDAVDFFSDTLVLVRNSSFGAYRIDPSKRPLRVDTLSNDAIFTVLSPDAKHLAWHSDVTNQLVVGSFPPAGKRQVIAAGGVEPMWLSNTELLYRSNVTWYKARLDGSGELTAAPALWARDTRFLDTRGWSNRPSWDGGIIYSQSGVPADARYVRFVPDFAARVKAAVDAAKRN